MQRAVVLDAHICDHPMSPFEGHIHVLYFMEKSVTELKVQQDKEAELSDDPFTTSNEESNDGTQHSK